MAEVTYLQAIGRALHQEMERDANVFVLGEDIGVLGGAFKLTRGFLADFGAARVIDTPMSEAAIVGAAIGAALMGMRPVVEMQFADFISKGFDQLVNVAAKIPYTWGARVPLVVRAPYGGGVHGGPFHSQCPEAWFTHVPGLKIVAPATVRDATGLLKAAIRDDNPVLYFEHKWLYRRLKDDLADEEVLTPIGVGAIAREGSDLTVISYGAMVQHCLEAAAQVAGEGIDAQVLDLRTLVPLDKQLLLASVKQTGKALIVHEATRTGGYGAELASILAEEAFDDLDGPITRVTAPDTPVPYSPPLEEYFLPDANKIASAMRRLSRY